MLMVGSLAQSKSGYSLTASCWEVLAPIGRLQYRRRLTTKIGWYIVLA